MLLLIIILYLANVHIQETQNCLSNTTTATTAENKTGPTFGQSEVFYNKTQHYKLKIPDSSGSLVKYIKDLVFGDSTLGDFEIISRTKNYVNTEKKDFTENGVEFDLRKREDAYKKTDPKDFPYTVSLTIVLVNHTLEDEKTQAGLCTGSLLTAEWVLTSEHCLWPQSKVYVYAGGNSADEVLDNALNKVPLPPYSQLIISETIFTDEQGYDIALIKLPAKFNLTDTVNTVQLASEPWRHRGYRKCVTTAFGSLFLGSVHYDDWSRKTHELEVKNPCLCNHIMKTEIKEGRPNTLGAQEIVCAMPRRDFGICGGDSGGGLVCDGLLVAVNMLLIEFVDVTYCESNLIGNYLFDLLKPTCGSKNSFSVFQLICPSLQWINKHVKLFNNTSECWHQKSLGTPVTFHYWTIAAGMTLSFITMNYFTLSVYF